MTLTRNYLITLLLTSVLASSVATLPELQAADAPAPVAKAALTVNVISPTVENWDTAITANGALNAWQEAVVAAEIGGQRIDKLLVDVGDQVRRGQTLAELAQATVQAELAQAQAHVTQAEASLEDARTNAERARRLCWPQAPCLPSRLTST